MQYDELGLNRFGKKADQNANTESAVQSSVNPSDNVFSKHSNSGVDNGRSDAKNVLTGTVIVSCIIKTSDGPARVELSGNDMKLYDDSKGANGVITGNTSTITFLRSDKNPGEFILQKRHGKDYDLDNVMDMFYTAGSPDRFNYLFIGRKGSGGEYNTNYMEFVVNSDSSKTTPAAPNNFANGSLQLRLARDGVAYAGSGYTLYDASAAGGVGAVSALTGEGVDGGVVIGWVNSTGALENYIQIDASGITANPALGGGYRGRVASDGTAGADFPSGWTSSTTGTGVYRVDHNLGSGVYSCVASIGTADLTSYVLMNANYFRVFIRDLTGAPTDSAYNFILLP